MSSLSSLRCAVLGATGFLGRNLCKALTGTANSIKALARSESDIFDAAEICWVIGDFRDPGVQAKIVKDCDVIFHMAGSMTPERSNSLKVADILENLVPTVEILEICREQAVSRIVFVSSGGTVYGNSNVSPTQETCKLSPISAYAVSKIAIEYYLFLFKYLYNIDYKVLRVSNPYGPFQIAKRNQGVIGSFFSKAISGRRIEVWGDGLNVRDFIFVDDVVEAILSAAIYEGSANVFNIGSGKGHSVNEIISKIEFVTGIKFIVEFSEQRSFDIRESVLDITLARKELDWHPKVALEEGLKKTWEWFRANNFRS